MKRFIFIFLAALVGNALGFTSTVPTQYSNLQWTVGGSTGLEPTAYCNSMTLNGIADFANSSIITFSGTLNCNNNAGAYVVSGTGYLNNLGGISLGITVGGSYFWNCATNANLFANCKAYAGNGAGALLASPTITFR